MTDNPEQTDEEKIKSYADNVYNSAVKKLGQVTKVQNDAIVSQINKIMFGKPYNSPLWNMKPSKANAIINNTVTVDYEEQDYYKPPTQTTATSFTEPVAQEQQVSSLEDIPEQSVVADKQTLPKFTYHEPISYHNPEGRDIEIQAVGIDKYGKPIWKQQNKGQGIFGEVSAWMYQIATNNAYEYYLDQQNARKNAEYALQNVESQRQNQLAAQGVNTEAIKSVEPTEQQIKDKMAVDSFQNELSNIGRYAFSLLDVLGGAMKNVVERPIGTLAIMSGWYDEKSGWQKIDGAEKKYGVKQYEVVKGEKQLKNITLDEAWQASRLTFDTFGQTNQKINEFIRRYREDPDADPAELEKDLENVTLDTILSIAADPANVLDRVNAAQKVAKGLKNANKFVLVGEMASKFDELDNAITGARKAVDIVPPSAVDNVVEEAASVIDNIDQTEIRAFDASLPAEEQLPIASKNFEIAKQTYSDAVKAAKAIDPADVENLKVAQDAAKQAKGAVGNWRKNVKAISEQVENNRKLQQVADALSSSGKKAKKIDIGSVPSVRAKMDEFIQTVNKNVDAVDAAMQKKARNMTDTQMKKTTEIGDTIRDEMTMIAAMSDDSKEFGRMIASMVTVVSKNVSDLSKQLALANIMNHPAGRQILSEGGMETAVILREMFSDTAGKVNVSDISKLIQQAQGAADPLAEIATLLDKRAYKVANQLFPDIFTRIKNIKTIETLQQAGKPIPSYLKRFMDGDTAEKISPFYEKIVKAHDLIQNKIIFGKAGLADANKLMAGAYISANPPTWFRNAVNNATTMFVDGANPFMTSADMEKIFRWGSPSQTDVAIGGTAAVIPGTEESDLFKKIGAINSKIEQFQAKQVVSHALNEAMKDQFKVIYRDLQPQLLTAGFTKDEVEKLTRHIYEAGNVDAGITSFFDMNKHRVATDFMHPDDLAKLDGYIPSEKITEAVQSGTKRQAKSMIEQLKQVAKQFGDQSLKEEAVVDVESKYFKGQIKEMLENVPEEFLDKENVDLIGRKVVATEDTFVEARKAISSYRTALQKAVEDIRYSLDEVAQRELGQRLISATEILNNADVEFSKYLANQSRWQQTEGAELLRRAKAAEKAGDRDIAGALYNEFKALSDEMWTKTGADQIKAFQKSLADAQAVFADVDGIPKAKTNKLLEQLAKVDALNDVDVDAYRVTDELYSKTTGEKIDFNVMSDAMASLNRAYKEAEPSISRLLDKLSKSIDENWDSIVPPGVSQQKMDALKELIPTMKSRLSDARAKGFEYANLARESSLLDYRKKTTADVVAAYLMPFQFWYRRSYGGWLKRIVDKPGMVVAYVQYRQALEKYNANMPEWYRYQINLGHMLGLPEDNPLYFQLEQMVNPLNGLLGMDYNDSRRRKDTLPAVIDTIGKYGPSTHTLISWAIAASYAMKGDADTAEAWAGRSIPITKLIKDVTSVAGLNQSWDAKIIKGTPGGVETDPLLNIFMGGVDSYENKRIARKLAEMVQRGEISGEDAAAAAHDQSGDTWNLAWKYAQNDPNVSFLERRGVLSSIGGIFGVGLRGRTEQDILNDKFFEEYSLLRGIQNNLSPSEYKQKLVQLYERYPFGEYLVLSKKNDVYRDQAWAYSVLDRIKPGELSGYSKAAGLDSGLLDKFYDDKGRIDRWDTSDKDRFLAAIRDISVMVAIPPEATQHDYNTARIRNMQLNEYMKSVYGADINDRINALYDIDAKDTAARNDYLRNNPDVAAAIRERDQNVLADPLLEKYYGGIDKLETYLQYQKRGVAQSMFGSDIYELVAAYYKARDNGYDTRAMREDYPQLAEYFEWNAEEEKKIQAAIDSWGDEHLPSSASNIINPTAIANSIGQENIAKYMTELNEMADVDAFLAPYMTTRPEDEYTESFNMAKYIDEQAEQRWIGITDRIAEFEKAKASDVALASQMWASDPTISMYYTFVRGIQSQASQAEKGIFPGDNMGQQVVSSMSPELYRLAQDKVNGYDISKTAEKQLKKIATKLGITYNELLMYVLQNTGL